MMSRPFNIFTINICLLLSLLTSCTDNEPQNTAPLVTDGGPATVYAYLGETVDLTTRATHNAYDFWSIATFTMDDNVGLFTVKGMQDPDNVDNYDLEVINGKMFFEAASGSYYRFSNSEIILSPTIVHNNYSIMYYPYYDGMPDPHESSTDLPGIPLRQIDESDDKVKEKCLDFMQTSMYSYQSYGSYYSSSVHKLNISNGILQPSFYHYMAEIVVQRGDGFQNAPDRRVWVVTKDAYTDIRVTQTSTTTNYTYQLQNALDTGETIDIPFSDPDNPDVEVPSKFTLNKNRVWQAWQGADYNSIESYYVIVPPVEVAYILMQDDNQNWRAVSDFYLDFPTNPTSKTAKNNCRYIVTAMMQGIDAIIRPVTIQNWTDGGSITDQLDSGINNLQEYTDWVALYNAYTSDRNENLEEDLSKFGDMVKNSETGEAKWTFYINANLKFPDNFDAKVLKLDDILKGGSVYTNYTFSNIKTTLFEEMGENGGIEALDFHDIYIIDTNDNGKEVTGGLVTEVKGGSFENCHIVNGIIVSNKAAGMLGGLLLGASVKNCHISGQVIGASTANPPYQGLFGTDAQEDLYVIDSNYKELYFESFN